MSETIGAHLPILLFALAIDAAIGYPQTLFHAIGHPVSWAGRLIEWLDRRFNRESDDFAKRRLAGILGLAVVIASALLAASILEHLAGWFPRPIEIAALAVLSSTLLAQRSLHDHVKAVGDALEREGLGAGRNAVAMIVGRDPETLDEAGICRAAIESLAESISDGVVAPAFWLALGSLEGGVFYKVVNTADSMIGHRTERHEAYGWAAARLDDLINLPASRLSGLLIVLAAAFMPGASARQAWRVMLKDAHRHKSPNAGWPEAAMAGALSLKLAGPRIYDGETVDSVFIGDGRFEAGIGDIRRALRLARIAAILQAGLVAFMALALWR